MTTAGVMTLSDFLLARIRKDEERARAAGDDRRWRSVEEGDDVLFFSVLAGTGPRYNVAEAINLDTAEHIARWDPARVLAECEAKRRIVERYGYLHEHGDSGDMRWVLPLLALPYADHADYREEWKP